METYDLESSAYHADPYPTLRAMVAAGPVVATKIPVFGKIYWVTHFDAVRDFLKNQDDFASDPRGAGHKNMLGVPWLPRSYRILMQNLLLMDDPDHRRLRKLVDGPFRKGWIDQYRPTIAEIADRLLDQMERAGNPDICGQYARALPLEVICEILGLEGQREDFKQWMHRLTGSVTPWSMLTMLPTLRRILAYMQGEIDRVRAKPAPGLLSELVHAEDDGERMDGDELLSMITLLFMAGHETTAHLISTAIYGFVEHPEQLAALRADASLMPAAVEEVLRYIAPVQGTKPRMARADMEFHGVSIKRGERVMALMAAAHVDDRAFADPLEFNIRRDEKAAGKQARHLGFGGGIHLCLGLHLARAEAQIALERLYARWDNIRFAVPVEQLPWHTRLGLRGFSALPVEFDVVGT